MRTLTLSLLSLLLVGCSTDHPERARQNRACILAENALAHDNKTGTCESVSLGETVDFALWRFDGGERLCHDVLVPDRGSPLPCVMLKPTKADLAADAKAQAEAEVRAKMEADAKAATAASAGSGSGSAKTP